MGSCIKVHYAWVDMFKQNTSAFQDLNMDPEYWAEL